MRHFAECLLLMLFITACTATVLPKALDRQYQWDMAKAENRCEWGYEHACIELERMNHDARS
jgi:hypothetical protein